MSDYKVLKPFEANKTIGGKSETLKSGEIIPGEVAETWRNLRNLENCRYIMPVKEIVRQPENRENREIAREFVGNIKKNEVKA